ncbi:MAG TPA: lipoyl(octanoyl) transferase LipB [Puia sp.]|nr:lipoyl(octanoyl) transferase LipB [Puia sp.]
MSMQPVIFSDLGKMEYATAWQYQESLLKENVRIKTDVRNHRSAEKTINHLLFVEHPPVYTLGKSGNEENVLMDEQTMKNNGIEFFRTNRGGDITFHGPGQIVVYPILDLEYFGTDIGKYLRSLEEVVIHTLQEYRICGQRSAGQTGVWIEPELKQRARKICAIGVRCSRWITMHGLALNVNTDLSYFNHIVPCGIADKQVTSMEKELQRTISLEEVKEKIMKNFEAVFHCMISNASLPGAEKA